MCAKCVDNDRRLARLRRIGLGESERKTLAAIDEMIAQLEIKKSSFTRSETAKHRPADEYDKACGAEGFRCERPEEVRSAIQAALNSAGAAIVEALVDAEEAGEAP